MTDGRFDLYVLCATASSAKRWESLRDAYFDLDVKPVVCASAIEKIRQIALMVRRPFLVCCDRIWLGRGSSLQVTPLIDELNARFPNWALCGNRGVRWDGQGVYDYSYDMTFGGLQTAVCAHPVISIDDALLLVNSTVLIGHTALAPAVARCLAAEVTANGRRRHVARNRCNRVDLDSPRGAHLRCQGSSH